MAWDLWSLSYDQVAFDGNYSEHPEWQRHFYCGCNRDVLEEDALNEGYCVQVLRILITKADTEIEELEKDLLSLQNELAFVEHEKWPEICCSALTERIKRLDVAVSTLKKDHADETETRLLLHNKPAETLHEIVKALQRDHCQYTNGQLVDANILKPIINATEYALQKESINIDSNIVLKKEEKKLSGTTENSRSSELLLELQEKRQNDAGKLVLELLEKRLDDAEKVLLELREKRPDDAGKRVLGLQEKRPDDAEKVLLELQEKRPDDAEKLVLELQEKRPDDAEKVLLELQEKRPDDAEKLVLELQEKRPDDAEKLPLELQEKRPDDAEKVLLELQEKRPDDADKVLLKLQDKRPDDAEKLLLELQEKRLDGAEMVEELLAMAIVRSPGFRDISYSPGHSDGMKLSGTPDDGITGNEEVRRSQLIASDTGRILNLRSSMGNGNIPRDSKRENEIVKDKHVSSDALRPFTGITGRKKCIDSSFGASHQQKGRNSDLEKKLCRLSPTTAGRPYKKESKVAPDEDLDSMNCPLQVVYPQDFCPAGSTELCSLKGGNGKNSRLLKNIQNTSLIHAENSALISLFDTGAKSARYTGLQPTDEEKPLPQGLKSENADNLIKPDMSFSSELKTHGKRKSELETFSNTSLILSTKRQRKSAVITDDTNSNDSMNSEMNRRAVWPGLHEVEVRAIVPFDSQFSEFQKKKGVSKSLVTVGTNSNANLDIIKSDKVDQLSKLYSLVDSHTETADSLSEALKNFKMNDLKVVAKEFNVKQYYKLKKADLIDLLVEQLSK